MSLHWTFRKGIPGADAADPDDVIVVQIEPIYSRTGRSVSGYEWYAYRLDRPPFNHKLVAKSHSTFKLRAPFPSRKAAIEDVEKWHQEYKSAS